MKKNLFIKGQLMRYFVILLFFGMLGLVSTSVAADESEKLVDPFSIEKSGGNYQIDDLSQKDPNVPTISGPRDLTLDLGSAFPFEKFSGKTANGQRLQVELVTNYSPEQTGMQPVILRVSDTTNNRTNYAIIHVTLKAKAIFPKNTIQFNGQKISFTNGGVSRGKQIIDSNNRQVSTYFGNNFSPSDHAFTHFIAHNPGAGQNFMSLKNNNSVVVSDSQGQARTYKVYKIVDVPMVLDNQGYTTSTTAWGQEVIDELYYGDLIGEQVVFQTCVKPDATLVRFVYAK